MTCSLLLFTDIPGRCQYCGDILPKYRRRWCDDECSLLVATNHVWTLAKRAVYLRDASKCQMCGCHVWNSVDIYKHPERPRQQHISFLGDPEGYRRSHAEYAAAIEQWQLSMKPFMAEVNHIVPRNGGGYNSGCHNHLDNLQLLCHRCHVGVTKQQRADRKSVLVRTD